MSERDAAEMGIQDNDWVEVYNDHGVYAARCTVSARVPPGVCLIYHVPERTLGIPKGACIQYHATERTYGVPKSPLRGMKRAGMNNSLTRTRLKPNLMVGGYGQFTYHFNYWGPIAPQRDTHVVIVKMTKVQY